MKVTVLNIEHMHTLREAGYTEIILNVHLCFSGKWHIAFIGFLKDFFFFLTSKQLKTFDLKSILFSFYDHLSYFSID